MLAQNAARRPRTRPPERTVHYRPDGLLTACGKELGPKTTSTDFLLDVTCGACGYSVAREDLDSAGFSRGDFESDRVLVFA